MMRVDQADDLYQGRGVYHDLDGGQLRWLVAIGDYRLVTVASFPRHHAWLVTAALSENGARLDVRPPNNSEPRSVLPAHDGAVAFVKGEPLESQR
ncbi:MAG: hypothetical protein GTO41_03935 [Burkholderiales bacterium]|nr:hypothetical protein [Burkholderiales bacterium]